MALKNVLDGNKISDIGDDSLVALAAFVNWLDTAGTEELKAARKACKDYGADFSGSPSKRVITKQIMPAISKRINSV